MVKTIELHIRDWTYSGKWLGPDDLQHSKVGGFQ